MPHSETEGLQQSARTRTSALRRPAQVWFLALLICTFLMVLSFLYLDVPIAKYTAGMAGATKSLGTSFSSIVLVGAEAGIALGLVVVRLRRGQLSPFWAATALACLTSICAYATNDGVLKLLFGVPNPRTVLEGTPHTFHLFGGSSNSSFPSGHMVLAGAFAGVFLRLYQRSMVPLSLLLLIGAVLLILGDWHFVSDVISGAFLGISAGLLAGEVWHAHSREALRTLRS